MFSHQGSFCSTLICCAVAFCFYNLSSIVNGLVYFDQFSMLSTLHLLLVGLGIAVLLSGVWIISFPPGGGGGVDVGTWHEGDSAMELTGEDSDIEEAYEDEPLPMDEHARAESARGRTSSGLGLHVITEPPTPIAAPQLSPPPTTPARSSARGLLSSLPARRSRTTSTGPEQSLSPEVQSPGSASSRRRRRTTLAAASGASQLSPTASHFAPSLPPSASGLGGFSIGLSPISPGFSIVPRERRRRMTGHGSGNGGASGTASGLLGGDASSHHGAGAGAASDAGSVGSAGRGWKMRRVVSEGDAMGAAPLRVDGGVGSDSNEVRRLGGEEVAGLPYGRDVERAGGGGGQDTREHAGSTGLGRRAKGRWKWLRNVLGSTDPPR